MAITFDEFMPAAKEKNPKLSREAQKQWNVDHGLNYDIRKPTAPDFVGIAKDEKSGLENFQPTKETNRKPVVERPQSAITFDEFMPSGEDADASVKTVKPGASPSPIGGNFENLAAGVGSSFADLALGVKQRWRELENYTSRGLPGSDEAAQALQSVNQEVADKRKIDAPLMATKAGKIGAFTGTMIPAVAAGMLPGGQGLAGSMLTGAGLGLVEPTTGNESVVGNTAISGALGGVVPGAMWAGRLGKSALIDPFTRGGHDDIARTIMRNFGIRPSDVASATSNPTITGARRTLAEQIDDPAAAAGAARLQDSLRSNLPENSQRYASREMENNAARVGVLNELAGTGGQREFFSAARETAAEELYRKAFKVPIDMAKKTPAERGELTKLLNMPAIQDAMTEAKKNAANKGLNLKNPSNGTEGLHMMKLAMDDAVNKTLGANPTAAQVNKADAIKSARDRLVTFIERMSPDYTEARVTYKGMSKPINQMDVAGHVLQKGTSATSDLGGTPRLMPDGLMRSMRDEGALIKSATGRQPAKELSGLLESDQLTKLNAVASETDRAAAVARAGAGPGSATAQRMASQNILNKLGGGGLMGSALQNSTFINNIARPVQYLYQHVAEPRIQAALTEITLNPGRAKQVMEGLSFKDRSLLSNALSDRRTQQVLKASLPALFVSQN